MGVRRVPDMARTVWVISDPHIGPTPGIGLSDARRGKLLDYMTRFPAPAAVVIPGDCTQDRGGVNEPAADARFLAFCDEVCERTGLSPAAVLRTLGNHDAMRNNRTMEQARVALRIPSKNQLVDLDFCRLLMLGPEDMTDLNTMRVSRETLDWMVDTAAEAPTVPHLVFFHAPLRNTHLMGPDPTNGARPDSSASGYHAHLAGERDDASIRAAIASAPNIEFYGGGHTHWESDHPSTPVSGVFKDEAVGGGRVIAHASFPSPFYNGSTLQGTDQIRTTLVTVGADRSIEARWLNHTGRHADAPDSRGSVQRVVPV